MATRRRYFQAPRKLIFTREGRWFTGMTLLVGIGAVNTGNNLLYLLLGMMLGLIIASGILSEWMLQKVKVRRVDPGDLFAGRTSRLTWEISNNKRLLSSYSIFVQEYETRETRRDRRLAQGLAADLPTRRKEREEQGEPAGPRGLALRVPAKKNVVIAGEYVFPRRGLYRYAGVDVGTRFPFGFFEKRLPLREAYEVLVYPAIRMDDADERTETVLEGEVAQSQEGRTGDFFGLREYREGDDLRDVHWKVSARRGVMVRRLYERHDNEAVAVYLYNWVPVGLDEPSERAAVDSVERAINEAATLCARLSRQGRRFSLHTIDEHVAEGSGAGQLQSSLRHLALVAIRRDSVPPTLDVGARRSRILLAASTTPPWVAQRFDAIVEAPARAA